MKIAYPIQIQKIKPSFEFYDEVVEMNLTAKEYINGFKWCEKIREEYLYLNLGSTICVFLYHIDNIQKEDEADNILWVIVGDLPSMYLDTFNVKSLKEVLETYAELAEDWADNILKNKSVKNCFPFDEKPNLELANQLKSRVNFITNTLIKNIYEIQLIK
jgi:hypothetical protein